MSSAWAPNETDYQIYAEKIWLQANILQNIPYGVELALFVTCFVALVQNMDHSNFRRHVFLMTFITIIFGLGTVYMITNSLFTQQAFIEYRNFPGGPGAYLNAMFANTVGLTNSVSWVVSNWLLDGFLVWRFIVIYSDVRPWYRAMFAIPCLMLLASIILGSIVLRDIAAMAQAGTSNSTPFAVADLTLSYYTISLALNILVTIMIAARLLAHRHHIARLLGSHHAASYANTAAIIVESAVLYAVFAFAFLVSFGVDSAVSNVFINFVNSTQAVSAFLIILRLTKGNAWSTDTNARIFHSAENVLLESRAAPSVQYAPDRTSDVTVKDPSAILDGDVSDQVLSRELDRKV
ncbi:uncharacterized protein C8Q71DRAFT_721400 [Rhodofomes roseus]|uniref:Uncharacterized protein n=1 Tax=Rhodofomes roseus TaxID=34475 RepID=A0ABQ8KS64_9APHY|nr:uncharacterized protein C8Q71DRAFT_721400 [Rhodofomes roseus]KAH9840970.1 hypothetical protein C8Q71DRAFT_721400 [Rhodofomes roseus]